MPHFESINRVSNCLKLGEFSAHELCSDMLDTVESLNPAINAYSDIIHETALAEAEASDRRRKLGQELSVLDGVPIAIKDLIDTSPAYCSAGLKHLKKYRPERDAPIVKLLRDSGAVILGATHTDPGAFSTDTPQTINPIAKDRTTGGSSGGSASAVAAGLAFAALGTDTGGSIRIPAACCSLYGLKPSWGRVAAEGVLPLSPSADHLGPLARSLDDLCAIQQLIDPVLGEISGIRKPIRLGVSTDYYSGSDEAIKNKFTQIISKLEANNTEICEIDLPSPEEALHFHMINVSKEAADFHNTHYGDHWQGYPEIAKETISYGLGLTQKQCDIARQQSRIMRANIERHFDKVDAIIMPTMPVDTPMRGKTSYQLGGKMIDKLTATIFYTALFNQTGHPAISMPMATFPDGRAMNCQLIGKFNYDAALLALAKELDQLLSVRVDYVLLLKQQNFNIEQSEELTSQTAVRRADNVRSD